MSITKVGIAGAGTMGRGIAQLCALSGFRVFLYDASQEAVQVSLQLIKDNLAKAAGKGKITVPQYENAMRLIYGVDELGGFYGCDIIIEAVYEDLDLKQMLFKNLSAKLPNAILATNTSSLSVSKITATASNPELALGMHFFNPAYAMKLVEIVRAPKTSENTLQSAWDFALKLERRPVKVLDTPGFIVNRVLRPFYLEAMRIAEEGGGCLSWIDKACKEEGGTPMGPFELMDMIGLDVNYATTCSVYEGLGKPERFTPNALQKYLVKAGQLGKKSGKGFYIYEGEKAGQENEELLPLMKKGEGVGLMGEAIWKRIMDAISSEAALLHQEGAATKEDIDAAVKLGAGFIKGPFEWRN